LLDPVEERVFPVALEDVSEESVEDSDVVELVAEESTSDKVACKIFRSRIRVIKS